MAQMLSESDIKELTAVSRNIRRNVIKMIHNAKSGHPGGSLSCVELLTVLFTKVLKYYPECEKNPDYNNRDRFVLSKGHASATLYAVMSHCGYFDEKELMTFRKLGSRLQGHPSNTKLKGIEVSTGSLGQGLSISCGIALGLKLDNINSKVFTLLGDGEAEEGSVWEAVMNANARKLDNLIVIVDRNRLQIDGDTESIKGLGDLKAKFESFGWNSVIIDGHDVSQIYGAYMKALKSDKPFAIIADTIKGKGVSFMENDINWHGKAPNDEQFEAAIKELESA